MSTHNWAIKGVLSESVYMPYRSFVHSIRDEGLQLTLCGWHLDSSVKDGDVLLLPNDGETTHYLISKIRKCNDSSAMFFIDCEFYPTPSNTKI